MEFKPMLPVRKFVLIATLGTLLAALGAQPANAVFISSGVIPLPSGPPPNIQPGGNENALPIVFPEMVGGRVTSLGGLPVDHDGSNVIASPTISGNVVNPALVSATLPYNTRFNSYIFHFDPVGSPFFAFYVATISFDHPIIGVQIFSNGFELQKPNTVPYTGTLEAGDAEVLANGGPIGVPNVLKPTYYPSGVQFRGLEEDSFVLAISGNTIQLAGSAHGIEIDQIRILTAVPEPLTAVSWAIIAVVGCGGGFIWRRHKVAG
jgi:hypothetical protein